MNVAAKQASGDAAKAMVIFYSHSGNTRALAGRIQAATGGDIVEIQPRAPNRRDYDAVVKQAKQELQTGFMPALVTTVASIAPCDTIFVGLPN